MQLDRWRLPTPVGPMLAIASPAALCALEFEMDARLSRLDARLARFYPECRVADGWNDVLEATRRWLETYFDGSSADHEALPLDARSTSFECRVWQALRTIGPGRRASYGQMAAQVGSPAAARAVGLANGANPIAIVVPCHRVIGAGGTLVGYGGGLARKRWLLEHERRHWPDREASARLPFDS